MTKWPFYGISFANRKAKAVKVNDIDFIWSGEIVSMIGQQGKYHVRINCTSQLIELILPKETTDYRLGEKIIIQGNITVREIIRYSDNFTKQ